MNVKEAYDASSAAYVALHKHWSECCRSSAKHCLDDKDLCDTGKALYAAFTKAEEAYRVASWGDTLPLMADRELPKMEEAR